MIQNHIFPCCDRSAAFSKYFHKKERTIFYNPWNYQFRSVFRCQDMNFIIKGISKQTISSRTPKKARWNQPSMQKMFFWRELPILKFSLKSRNLRKMAGRFGVETVYFYSTGSFLFLISSQLRTAQEMVKENDGFHAKSTSHFP